MIKMISGQLCRKLLTVRGFHFVTMESSTPNGWKVLHNQPKHEFMIALDSSDKAVLQYDILDEKAVDLHHTGVPTAYRGQGIAKVLAKHAMDHFSSEGIDMKLTCTYLQKFFKENPEERYTEG